jgi:hypothetical protein
MRHTQLTKLTALCLAVLCGMLQVSCDDGVGNNEHAVGVEWEILNSEAEELCESGKSDRGVLVAQSAPTRVEESVGSDHLDMVRHPVMYRNVSDSTDLLADSTNNRTTFRDSHGRTTGSATQRGDRTTFRDSHGRTTGSATQRGDRTTFRDDRGQTEGTATRTGSSRDPRFRN